MECDLLMFKSLFKSVSAIPSVGAESEGLGHFHILFHFIDNMILYNLLRLLYLGRNWLDLLECVWLCSYLNLGGVGIGHIVMEFAGASLWCWLALWCGGGGPGRDEAGARTAGISGRRWRAPSTPSRWFWGPIAWAP
jgi:hypothetical protein